MEDRELVALMAAILYATPGPTQLSEERAVVDAHRLLDIVSTKEWDGQNGMRKPIPIPDR